jgi:hypothetical protein
MEEPLYYVLFPVTGRSYKHDNRITASLSIEKSGRRIMYDVVSSAFVLNISYTPDIIEEAAD